MTTALSFTDNEAIITYTARLMEEDRLYFVAIGGPPLLAVLLAKVLRAPKITYVVEDGTIAPEMPIPAPPFMLGAGLASRRAVAWTDMNTVDFHAGLGYIDYGVLAAVQVDPYGNFNSTFVGGEYDRPERRFGGPGGANEIASLCWRTILMTRLQRRKFVPKLDFMSSPGFLDGSPGARERAGLPPETGRSCPGTSLWSRIQKSIRRWSHAVALRDGRSCPWERDPSKPTASPTTRPTTMAMAVLFTESFPA